jgi:hypothetical protein
MISKYLLCPVAAGLLLFAECGGVAQRPPRPPANPHPFVSAIFGDNMVLQRGKPNTLWGWSDPGDTVRDTIIVSSPAVPHPTEVRYAWQSNPAATLFNGAGLPAAPFRTEAWPVITEGRRPY